MYVTDVPVVDRITNPAGREISAAMALFEDMAADLYGAADWVAKESDVNERRKALDHLSGCTESALAAQHAIREALALLDIATD